MSRTESVLACRFRYTRSHTLPPLPLPSPPLPPPPPPPTVMNRNTVCQLSRQTTCLAVISTAKNIFPPRQSVYFGGIADLGPSLSLYTKSFTQRCVQAGFLAGPVLGAPHPTPPHPTPPNPEKRCIDYFIHPKPPTPSPPPQVLQPSPSEILQVTLWVACYSYQRGFQKVRMIYATPLVTQRYFCCCLFHNHR